MEMLNELSFTGAVDPKPVLANLRNVLTSSRFCTLCYNNDYFLRDLDEYPFIEEYQDGCDVSLRGILQDTFRDEASKIIISNYICYECKERLLDTYTFTQKTIDNAHNFENYLNQLDSETVDLLSCLQEDVSNAVIVIEENKTQVRPEDKFKWTSNTVKKKQFTDVTQHDTRRTSFACSCCQKIFYDKKFLAAHLKAKVELCTTKKPKSGEVICPMCKTRPCEHEKFIENFLDQKIMKCPDIKCLECDYTSNTLRPLITHVNNKHMDALSDNCELCGKIFHLREQYISHFQTFHKNYKICKFCYEVIPQLDYKLHVVKCKNIEKLNCCDLCPARFESELQATIHTLKHDDVPKKPKNKKIVLKRSYSCPLCPMKFDGKIKLQKHASVTHCNVSYKNNLCQFCNIQFSCRKEYLQHVKETEHMGEIDPLHRYRHKCQYCDYTARHSFILQTHLNRYHLKVMPFQCDICSKRFLDKRKLKAHIDRHMGASKRVCDVCGDTLGSTTALVKHKRLHTGERPYPCHLCDANLNSASERNFHILRKHTEKTHPCPLCETKFHNTYFVRRHIQTVHWKRKEKFDHTKVEGLRPEHYELFRDKRMVVL